MPSPVKPSDVCSLVPNASDPACQSVKSIFYQIPSLICEFISYILDASGNLNEEFVKDIGASLSPPGAIIDYAGLSIPDGWLICNGQAVSRTEYADLFAAIGTLWGSGDGASTFNVPDFQKRIRLGRWTGKDIGNTGGSSDSVLPDHSHSWGWITGSEDNPYMYYDGFTAPEEMSTVRVRGDGESWGSEFTVPKDYVFDSGPGGDTGKVGGVTTIPIPERTVAATDGNLPLYGVTYTIIKT